MGLDPVYTPASRRPIADVFRRTGHAAVRACVRAGIHPDLVSYASVVAAAVAAACFAASGRWPQAVTGRRRFEGWMSKQWRMVALAVGAWALWAAAPLYGTLLVLLVPVARNRVQGQLQSVSLAVLGLVFVGWTLMHLAFLANTAWAYGYLGFVIFAVEVCDVSDDRPHPDQPRRPPLDHAPAHPGGNGRPGPPGGV